MGLRAAGLGLLICVLSCRSQKLDPDGRNVCLYRSDPTSPVCCSGWKQEGSDCPTALCEGESACQPSEICVYPGFCRCKAGFYGASCRTRKSLLLLPLFLLPLILIHTLSLPVLSLPSYTRLAPLPTQLHPHLLLGVDKPCLSVFRLDISPVEGGEFQEMSSKCNMFLDPSGFSGEDVASAFSIPRTSSIAKAKRPSVSFAEGTKFTTKERRGSSQEGAVAPRKSKSPWGVLMLSVLQPPGARGGEGVAGDGEDMQSVPSEETSVDSEVRDLESAPPRSSRRRTGSSARQRVQAQGSAEPTASDPDRISTVYVMAGAAGHPGKVEPEPAVEGPVQAVLRRLGSLQKPRGAVYKPPRRKLGARVTMWEEAAERGGASREAAVRKPSRRRRAPLSSPAAVGSSATWREGGPAERPASTILVSVRESPAAADTSDTGYLTIGAAAEPTSAQDEDTDASEDPHYENVAPRSS
nr:scavenger receptor class F member 1-like [Paramormyrops kingsleyae]